MVSFYYNQNHENCPKLELDILFQPLLHKHDENSQKGKVHMHFMEWEVQDVSPVLFSIR